MQTVRIARELEYTYTGYGMNAITYAAQQCRLICKRYPISETHILLMVGYDTDQ